MKKIIQTSKTILPLLAVVMLAIPASDSFAARPTEKNSTISTVTVIPLQDAVVKTTPPVTEICLPLNQPSKTKPVTARSQRPAGHSSEAAARLSALGLILGARYAITPSMDVSTFDRQAKKYCRN